MTRFVIFGAGAVGGVIGARLFQGGHDVAFIARGEHGKTMARQGLELVSPDETVRLAIPVYESPRQVVPTMSDIVFLTMKTQDTSAALEELAAVASPETPVVCAQNGVENERLALRLFANVYALVVQLPATHLVAGTVICHSVPIAGVLDLGRHPRGVDSTAREIALALSGAGFASEAREDIWPWKYSKLLGNLGNAAQAVLQRTDAEAVANRAREEGRAALAAAGIEMVTQEEFRLRHSRYVTVKPIEGGPRGGGSSWQSLARGAGRVESDYLNGEIILLGRIHGVPTPVNETLRLLAKAMAASHAAPGTMSGEDFDQALKEREGGSKTNISIT